MSGKKQLSEALDATRQLILDRSRELRLTLADLSRMAGRNEAYMHQYIWRRSPKKLPEEVRPVLAQMLDLPEEQLRDAAAAAPPPGLAVAPALPGARLAAPSSRDLPVYQMGDRVTAQPTEWTARPPQLHQVATAFAVWVALPSERLRPGDLAYVHPSQPPRRGDAVVVLRDGEIAATGDLELRDGQAVVLANGAAVATGEPERGMRLCRIVVLAMG